MTEQEATETLPPSLPREVNAGELFPIIPNEEPSTVEFGAVSYLPKIQLVLADGKSIPLALSLAYSANKNGKPRPHLALIVHTDPDDNSTEFRTKDGKIRDNYIRALMKLKLKVVFGSSEIELNPELAGEEPFKLDIGHEEIVDKDVSFVEDELFGNGQETLAAIRNIHEINATFIDTRPVPRRRPLAKPKPITDNI